MITVDLSGCRAIVTGSSRGIGAGIAEALASAGARVVLTGRDASALEAQRQRIGPDHVADVVTCDLREPSAATELIERAATSLGGLDLLVNNAGATKRGDFLTLTDDDFLDGFALKFHATVRMTRAAWPHLLASRGAIVNIVGVGSRTPAADFTIGGPVNSALVNFTKAIADKALPVGIRVNAVNPGHIVTDRLRRRIDAAAAEHGISTEEAQRRAREEIGIERFGTPAEIGALTAFLACPHASYIHGATLDIDGGATKGI